MQVNFNAERRHHEGPTRLDEALKYAVARIEKDPRSVETIVRYLGWAGRPAEAPPRIGEPSDLARERAKQAAHRTIERLREDGFAPDAVERSIALIEQSVPILDVELSEALMNARLCFIRLSCEALLAATQCFRINPPFEILRLGRTAALVKSGSAAGITQLGARIQELIQSRGCANTLDLIDDARAIFGPNASHRFTEAAVRTGGRFEWLDQETKWFWYIPDRGLSSHRLVNQIQRALAATPRIQLAKLRSAIRRENGFENFTPPLKVLASICRRLLFLQIEGDTAVRVPGMASWDAVLTANESCNHTDRHWNVMIFWSTAASAEWAKARSSN